MGFLGAACAATPGLRDRVDRLLRAAAGSFLEHPAEHSAATAAHPPTTTDQPPSPPDGPSAVVERYTSRGRK